MTEFVHEMLKSHVRLLGYLRLYCCKHLLKSVYDEPTTILGDLVRRAFPRLLQLCTVIVLLEARPSFAQAVPATPLADAKVLEALGTLGVAIGKEVITAARRTPPSAASGDPRSDLLALQAGYIQSRDLNRGALGILGADAEIVYTGIDAYTGGASLIGTMPVRWATKYGLQKMGEAEDLITRNAFQASLYKHIKERNLSFDARSTATKAQIKSELDQIPDISNLKAKLTDDPAMSENIDEVVGKMYQTVLNEQLDVTEVDEAKAGENQAKLLSLSHQVTDYASKTNKRLGDLELQVSENETQLQNATDAIENLSYQQNTTAGQLDTVEDILFTRSSATDKLTLLRSGYKQNELSADSFAALVAQTEAQAHREELCSQVSGVVNSISELGNIANNLHLPGEVVTAFQDASVVGNAIGNVLSGNYLGALSGLSGLFGGGGPSVAQQVITAMNSRFNRVDTKLDDVLKGEQKLGEAVVDLSKQVSAFSQETQSHLDSIDTRLATIQDLVTATYYKDFALCDTVRYRIRRAAGDKGITLNLRSLDQASFILGAQNSYEDVHNCMAFLSFISSSTTSLRSTAGIVRYQPLSVLYQQKSPATPAPQVTADAAGQYDSVSKTFLRDSYLPSVGFYREQIGKPLQAFGLATGANAAHALALAASPSPTVTVLRAKLALADNTLPACTTNTQLSAPLRTLLCSNVLPALPLPAPESQANTAAGEFLNSAIMVDALSDIADWSEFFAPIADYEDASHARFVTSQDEFFALPLIIPNGKYLLQGALAVDTIGIAQTNVLYGDMMATTVFNQLWDDRTAFPATAEGLTPTQAKAAALLLADNPFLGRNLLMLALDHRHPVLSSGRDESYAYALGWLKTNSSNDATPLEVLFGGDLHFKGSWLPQDPAHNTDTALCATYMESDRTAKCKWTAYATILGKDIPMPSVDAFSVRSLQYPQVLVDLLKKREELSSRIAEYDAFDYAASQAMNPKQRKIQLEKSVLEVLR